MVPNDRPIDDAEEILDSRPAPSSRRWWLLSLVVLVVLIVAAVLVQRGTSPEPTAEPTTSARVTTVPEPIIPVFSTGPAASLVPDTRTPGACSPGRSCATTSAPATVLAAIRSALRDHFGAASDVRITALSTVSSGHPSGSVLFSRTITARVPAGKLTILVSSAVEDAENDLLPSDGRVVAATADSFVAGYYTHALLEQRHGAAGGVPLAALDRLVNDTRLVTGRG